MPTRPVREIGTGTRPPLYKGGRVPVTCRDFPSTETMNNPDVRPPQARHVEPASPILPPGPLSVPGVVRILLSEAAGNALASVGEAFVVVGKGRYPDSNGRMVIYCQPAPLAVVNAACDVAMGKARAVRVKPPKPTSPTPSPAQ